MLGCVVVPSLNRPKELERLILSLAGFPVIVSPETVPRALPKIYWELLRGAFLTGGHDFAVMASDHLIFNGQSLSQAEAVFKERGLDHVVGFPVRGKKTQDFKVVAIGRDFYERFQVEDYHVLCPDYWHFHADTELGLFATELGLFTRLSRVYAIHDRHPNLNNARLDTTHLASRMHRKAERKVAKWRRKNGFLWGRDWKRVNMRGYK